MWRKEYQEFDFRYVNFKVTVGSLRGEIKQATGRMVQGSGEEMKDRTVHWRVLSKSTVFKVMELLIQMKIMDRDKGKTEIL